MTQPYLGEIRMFGGNFSPKNNAFCNGQQMSVQQNSALFSLLGTQFGGNGTTTFNLPDFRGRVPVCIGQGPGLSSYVEGQQGGTESVTLSIQQMPMHNHIVMGSGVTGTQASPVNNMPAGASAPFTGLWVAPNQAVQPMIPMDPNSLAFAGGNLPHENRMPALAITMIIALAGIFPSRN